MVGEKNISTRIFFETLAFLTRDSNQLASVVMTGGLDIPQSQLIKRAAYFSLNPAIVNSYLSDFNEAPPQEVFDLAEVKVEMRGNDSYQYRWTSDHNQSKTVKLTTQPPAAARAFPRLNSYVSIYQLMDPSKVITEQASKIEFPPVPNVRFLLSFYRPNGLRELLIEHENFFSQASNPGFYAALKKLILTQTTEINSISKSVKNNT